MQKRLALPELVSMNNNYPKYIVSLAKSMRWFYFWDKQVVVRKTHFAPNVILDSVPSFGRSFRP